MDHPVRILQLFYKKIYIYIKCWHLYVYKIFKLSTINKWMFVSINQRRKTAWQVFCNLFQFNQIVALLQVTKRVNCNSIIKMNDGFE